MALERLTRRILERATRGGLTKGWYELCRQGYLPGEIAAAGDRYAPDVRGAVVTYATTHNLPLPATCAPKRTASIKMTGPGDFREAFRDHAMRSSLALTLSRPMLELLCAMADDVQWDRRYGGGDRRVRPDNYSTTVNSLIHRGLVTYDARRTRAFALTPVGHRLIDLLKEARIFVRADLGHEHATEYRKIRREVAKMRKAT